MICTSGESPLSIATRFSTSDAAIRINSKIAYAAGAKGTAEHIAFGKILVTIVRTTTTAAIIPDNRLLIKSFLIL